MANRRHFDQMLKREWNRAMRTASPVGLLMIDTDHFKAYNDRHGHAQGDACLRQVAQALNAALNRVRGLGRRGGVRILSRSTASSSA